MSDLFLWLFDAWISLVSIGNLGKTALILHDKRVVGAVTYMINSFHKTEETQAELLKQWSGFVKIVEEYI